MDRPASRLDQSIVLDTRMHSAYNRRKVRIFVSLVTDSLSSLLDCSEARAQMSGEGRPASALDRGVKGLPQRNTIAISYKMKETSLDDPSLDLENEEEAMAPAVA